MGLVLGLPLALIYSTLFKNELGFFFGLKELWALYLVKRSRETRKPRFDLYDGLHDTDLYKMAIKLQPFEEKEEHRQNAKSLLGPVTDNALFYGTNLGGDRLVVRISRNGHGLTSSWLYLKLQDGNTYELPNERFYVEPKTGLESFVGGGLRFKCLVPMRQWRISFNGFLRNTNTSGNIATVHVKFGFMWKASSSLHDIRDELTASELAKFLAKQSKKIEISSFTKYLDSYTQVGNMFGTLQVENQEEREVYLWGARKRSKDICDPSSPVVHRENFVYSKDGHFLHHGEVKFSGMNGKLEYGFVIFSTGLGGPVSTLKSRVKKDNSDDIRIKQREFKMRFTIRPENETLTFKNGDFANCQTIVGFRDALVGEDDNAICLTLNYINNRENLGTSETLFPPQVSIPEIRYKADSCRKLVVGLNEDACRMTELTGGKGSSLANLSILSGSNKGYGFHVPKGLVVTATAYQLFFEKESLATVICSLENIAWGKTSGKLREACQDTVQVVNIKQLPESIEADILSALQEYFPLDFDSTKFAVRSSASGEDSEELSAAGQMTTYLGVRGIKEIFKAVVKCWASQFSFVAVQYKKQNGQILNSPMAVVVQEMVPADSAGVMFTCDPVTGNPANITITANYGIGESVVSAVADPDTVIHFRDENGLNGRVKVEVGRKSTQIVMMGTEGVKETETDAQLANRCCLSPLHAKRLAEIGLLVETAYGCPVDIEWAIREDNIYLLQSRPITTFDAESDFELRHEQDTPMRTEKEINSTCNVGEVLPGASSTLGLSGLLKGMDLSLEKIYGKRNKDNFASSPYFNRVLAVSENHLLIGILESVLRFYRGEENFVTNSQMVSLLGRILEDNEIFSMAAKRNLHYSTNAPLKELRYILRDMWCVNNELKEAREKYWNYKIDLKHCKTSMEAFDEYWNNFAALSKPAGIHNIASLVSMLYNLALLHILVQENKGWSAEVYSDLAYVLSTCGDVESVGVPFAIEHLSSVIAKYIDKETFRSMTTEEAYHWIIKSENETSERFKEFIANHGHRCWKEFDVQRKTWGTNPLPLIKSLQEMSGSTKIASKKKEPISVKQTIENFKTKMSLKSKMMARIAIPLCRKGVGYRERSKSLLIKIYDMSRNGYRQLYEIMAKEGRIPDSELIYYLSFNELEQLIKTRSPKLIQKAFRRKQLHSSMESIIYPEIMKGIPKAINYETERKITEGSFVMKGTPVSTGIAKGTARVATSLQEAADIKPGEILIAYSTDIGWSPYFPMLCGVATELGGLVSHGAVVAREYGLPCVVGVHGATLRFKSGDIVIINGSKGTLERL